MYLYMFVLFPVLWPSVTPTMDLKPNAGSDRAWVWNTLADYADECPKAEFLAIRFLNAESKYASPPIVSGNVQQRFQFACAAGIINLVTLV